MSDLLYAAFGPEPLGGAMAAFLALNLVAAVATVAVAAARLPARRILGAAGAYRLWSLPPLAALAALLFVLVPSESGRFSAAAAWAVREPWLAALAPVWTIAAALVAAGFAVAQARFLAQVRAGRAGPAVVGLISPRIVMPADLDGYTPEERELIRAHERAHVARKDPRFAAFAALAQCLCWFNPFAHLAAHLVRLDQELACDAAVILRRPRQRGLYARTLLKTQLAATPLPFGCYWPARGRHPLEMRVALLKRRDEPDQPQSPGPTVVLASLDAIRP